MTENKYPLFGFLIAGGAVVAVWAGLPPGLLLVLLVCPLMMFFMMRGMHGSRGSRRHGEGRRCRPQPAERATGLTGQRARPLERLELDGLLMEQQN